MKQRRTMKCGLKCLFAVFLLFFALEGYSFSAQQTDSLSVQLTDTGVSVHKMTWPEYHAYLFIDSCKTDSLVKVLENAVTIKLPEKRVAHSTDPFNPFIHETYLHVARGRFWFFGLSLFIILYLIYYRAVFSKQLELRMKSFLKKYYFEDLINEQKVSSIAGTLHAYSIGLLVFCQGVLLYVITSEYVALNSLITFLVALLFVTILFLVHYFMQFAFTSSLEIADLWKRQIQRQINVNLIFGIVMIPVFTLAYYNGSQLQNINLSLIVLTILIIWIITRLIIQLLGLFQDNYRSLVAILYFCTLEVIPYLLLFKYIKSTL
jgi:hypothetical protein